MISLPQALALAVGPANVAAAGHAVADWFDGRNCSGAGDVIREQLQDYVVPHNRPDTSLRAELKAELASQQEVVSSLRERVERLERRWAKERSVKDSLTVGGNGPAVSDGREPAAVVEQPSDRDLRQLYADTFDLRSDPASLGPAIVKFARAVLARWGHQSTPPVEGEAGELVAWLSDHAAHLRRMQEMGALSETELPERLDRAAELLQQRHAEPVPVSERLPGAEDCDEDGRCWLFSKVENEWRLLGRVLHLKYCFSHWLPATALPLPLPQQETLND